LSREQPQDYKWSPHCPTCDLIIHIENVSCNEILWKSCSYPFQSWAASRCRCTTWKKQWSIKRNKATNSHKKPAKERLLKLYITIFIVTAFNKVTNGHNWLYLWPSHCDRFCITKCYRQIRSGHVRSGQVRSNQIKSNQIEILAIFDPKYILTGSPGSPRSPLIPGSPCAPYKIDYIYL
jgi:hypothetical protein